jgi:hypothetical protein
MSIDAINTAMTPLQFARARSAARTVETAESSARRQSLSGFSRAGAGISPATAETATASRLLLPPARFHWTYRPIPGKSAAKRTPQLADSAYWSLGLNRLG